MAPSPLVPMSCRSHSQSHGSAGCRRTRRDSRPARDFLGARHALLDHFLGHRCEGRTIGTAGAQATIQRHGVAFFRGITGRNDWHGLRLVSLAADRVDAALTA